MSVMSSFVTDLSAGASGGLAARGLAVGAVAVGTDAAGGADTFGHACWC